MRKNLKLFSAISILYFGIVNAQVGIGTTTPQGVFDVVSTNSGVIVPRVSSAAAVTSPVNGMIIYDLSLNSFNHYENGAWSGNNGAAESSFKVGINCDTNGFSGFYVNGVALSGTTFRVTITNNSFSTLNLSFATSNLTLSGVSGITVSGVSPATSTLSTPGSSVVVTYTLSGTPASLGTLQGVWNLAGLVNCTRSVAVTKGNATFSLPLKRFIASINANNAGVGDIQGVLDNTANQLVLSLPYTGGIGSYDAYTSNAIAVVGESGDSNILTLSYPSGTFSASGTIPLTVTVGGTDSSFNITKQLAGSSNLFAELPFALNGNFRGDLTLTAVSCGAYVAPGVFKAFLCHNLGADTSLNPHIPVMGLQGGYVQWGRRGPNTTGDASLDWQTAANNSNFAAAPTLANSGNAGVISGWDTVVAANNSWRTAGGAKTANDPCPSGYRVPTREEWIAVSANNTVSRKGLPWTNGATNYGAALHYGPNASTKLLTLPAAGQRVWNDGIFINRGAAGYYWSSTETDATNAYHFVYNSANITSTASGNDRRAGETIRCIAE